MEEREASLRKTTLEGAPHIKSMDSLNRELKTIRPKSHSLETEKKKVIEKNVEKENERKRMKNCKDEESYL